MAFMMPVMKNNFDIYNGTRSRKTSECSNPSACNSRKVSESKSEGPSLSTSPGNEYSPYHQHQQQQRHHIQRSFSSKPFSRTQSRTSQGSFVTSPTRTSLPATAASSSPPKSAKKQKSSSNNHNSSEGSINKLFHLRLVDKLRKSLHNNNDIIDNDMRNYQQLKLNNKNSVKTLIDTNSMNPINLCNSSSESSSTLCSTQNLLTKKSNLSKHNSIISSTKALRIQQNNKKSSIDNDKNMNSTTPNTGYPISKSFSALLRRRISMPLSKASLKRRGLQQFQNQTVVDEMDENNETFNTDSTMSIESVSTGDIHSNLDEYMLKNKNGIMIMSSASPQIENVIRKRKTFFHRSRNRTTSTSSR